MVIVKNTTPPTVYLVELTCPFTRNIEAANSRKRERYEFLTSDIKDAGYQCYNLPFEIGSRGHVTRQNKITLGDLCNVTGVRKPEDNSQPSSLIVYCCVPAGETCDEWRVSFSARGVRPR